jgi:hypothetical protein
VGHQELVSGGATAPPRVHPAESQSSPVTEETSARSSPPAAAQVRAWFGCAGRLFVRDPPLWLGMSALYLALGIALKNIPFVGTLLCVLVSPVLLAGALLAARALALAPETQIAARRHPWWDIWLVRPLRGLLLALGDARQIVRLLVVCVLTLGFVLATATAEYLLTGGSLLSGLVAGELAAPIPASKVAAMLLAFALYVLLGMALYFLVPLTVFGQRPAFAALAEGLRACACHAVALGAFLFGFVVLALALSSLFLISGGAWFAYLLVFTLGVLALPLFVAGLYCSYRALFPCAA